MTKTEYRAARWAPLIVRHPDGRHTYYRAEECNCPHCDEYAHWQPSGLSPTADGLRTLGYDPDTAIPEADAPPGLIR